MKRIIYSVIAATTLSTSAIAGSIVFDAPDIAPVAAEVTDWSGVYAGATGGLVTGGIGTFLYPLPGDAYELTGSSYGAFVGHNFQRGKLVFGGEISAQVGNVVLGNFDSSHFNSLYDVKARVGYSMGSALLYGFAGASIGAWDNNNPAGTANPAGLNYGAGVDFRLNEKLFLGVEFIARDMNGQFLGVTSINPVFNAVQLRAGMRF